MPLGFAQWTGLDRKVCCTCEYWNGQRELDFKYNRVYAVLAQSTPQGRCFAKGNVLMSFGYSGDCCGSYKRWHKLP